MTDERPRKRAQAGRAARVAAPLAICAYLLLYALELGTTTKSILVFPVELFTRFLHETGHLLFGIADLALLQMLPGLFGASLPARVHQTIGIAGGPLFQLLVPVALVTFLFVGKRDRYHGSLALFWVGQNLLNIAPYAADAARMRMPLAGIFGQDGATHDWNYILGLAGLLRHADLVGTCFLVCGAAVIATAAFLSLRYALTEPR